MSGLMDRIRNRSERELERIEQEGRQRPARTRPEPEPAEQEERAGVGRDFSNQNADRLIKRLRERLQKATTEAEKADLRQRIKALEATRT